MYTRKMEQLKRDGYCVLEKMADDTLLEKIRTISSTAVAAQDKERLKRHKAPGSLINSGSEPGLADLIGNSVALDALQMMGLQDICFWKAVIISKPPGGPRLYWHQDCIMWHDPRAYSDIPPMIFLMYYLEDTTAANGCLRVIPGSHCKRHPLHELGDAHDAEVNRIDNPDDPRFSDYDGETDVPMKSGDALVGDARLLHATHANQSPAQRTVITIWFHPFFKDLQSDMQHYIHHEMHRMHASWPASAKLTIQGVIPVYEGDESALEVNRLPDLRLR